MKTIGLLGGLSWESTVLYYREINERMRAALGNLHSARIVMHSVDFEPIEKMQHRGEWDRAADVLVEAGLSVQAGGADFLVICTNTMHKVAPQIERALTIPILHIADATGAVLAERGIRKVGLLATAFTMEQDFYKGRLAERFGLEVLVPDAGDREIVHRVIYDELCVGETKRASKTEYLRIVDGLMARGADGVVLGCTEIGMLIAQADTAAPLFDTTAIHAERAVHEALS